MTSFLRVVNLRVDICSEKSLSSEMSCESSLGISFLLEILAEHWAQYLVLALMLLFINFLILILSNSSCLSNSIRRSLS